MIIRETRQLIQYDELYLTRCKEQSLERMPRVCGERVILEFDFKRTKLEKDIE